MCCVVVLALFGAVWLCADEIQMQNGDHYLGKVLSLDTNTLTLRSDVLGTVLLPRERVAHVTFGTVAKTNAQADAVSVAVTNGVTDLSASLRRLGANTNFIQQVQAQFLADAGPEANNKFNAMVGGLMSGKLTVNDIRAEAKSAADQLKQLKGELGEDGGWALDGYLAILEGFLRETTPPTFPATNSASSLLKARPDPNHEKK